ncbi:MAG: hypothetical protein WD889_01375, partial [Candidatus Colwellbacteria bacterium]
MMNKTSQMRRQFTISFAALLISVIALTAAVFLQVSFAWTNPASAPPGGSGVLTVSGGNVGIGTTAPGSKLHISGVDGGATAITIQSPTSGTGYRSLLTAAFSSAATGNYLSFNISSGQTTQTPNVLYLRGDGNVGIGTTGPGYKLDVASGGATTARF